MSACDHTQNSRTLELLNELAGVLCRCGSDKKSRKTFCAKCYFRLPVEMRERLYDHLGEGYEEAYQTACDFLDGKV